MNQQSLFISPSFSSDHICVEQNILLIVHRARKDASLTNSSSANFRISSPRHCFQSISFSISLRHSLSLPRFPLTVHPPQPQFLRRHKLSTVRLSATSQHDYAFISSVARARLEFGLTESHPPNLDASHELCANISATADTRRGERKKGRQVGRRGKGERGRLHDDGEHGTVLALSGLGLDTIRTAALCLLELPHSAFSNIDLVVQNQCNTFDMSQYTKQSYVPSFNLRTHFAFSRMRSVNNAISGSITEAYVVGDWFVCNTLRGEQQLVKTDVLNARTLSTSSVTCTVFGEDSNVHLWHDGVLKHCIEVVFGSSSVSKYSPVPISPQTSNNSFWWANWKCGIIGGDERAGIKRRQVLEGWTRAQRISV
ncbi:hypothetical protein BLNAU_24691 [Blattamonas nauphoetae]|uniref:Uncharacterized protein n=1 Tax=Blattamonas nauphoetae TaxID=2049346 RepID=A0ABQ9WLR2_9EUKA|nr:hypothetical protein BLNAU_24691 [Blattamonas nauphoetae]